MLTPYNLPPKTNCRQPWLPWPALAALLALLLPHLLSAQTLPGNYTTSWAGNSLVPATQEYNFVQNWANSMFVTDDGTIYANANWDEGAKELGIYRNGQAVGLIPNQHTHADGGAITANDSYIWASVHSGKVRRFDKTTLAQAGTEWQASTDIVRGLAATASEVFVSDFTGGNVKVYNAATSAFVRSWGVTRPGPLALDAEGNLWVLTYDANGYGPGSTIHRYSPAGGLLQTLALPAGVEAKSIAVDKVRNELLVTDIGDNMQVHIYNNIAATPALVQSFGVQGGILSGTKGLVAPLKFNVPSLVGVDGAGNLIVWCNGNNPDPRKPVDYDGMGTSLESYTRAGVRNWQLLGLIFVDMAAFDPATDGADLYTKHEHFSMDYTKPDGEQWSWKGWTLDRKTYAQSDRRLRNDGGHLSGIVMRRINGHKFMYISKQAGAGYSIFRFTDADEIAIPCGTLLTNQGWTDSNANGQEDAGETTGGMNWQYDMFATCVDKKGDIWYAFDDIRKHSLLEIVNGVPIYDTDTPSTVEAKPAPFYDVRRVEYDSDNDVMYITGYTPEKRYAGDWKSPGLVLARYDNWNGGNRTPTYTMDLPSADNGAGSNMVSIAVEKDYIFVMGVQTRGKVWVYYAANGLLAGTMVPGDNVGGVSRTGWGDLVNSLGAFRRSTGEYLVTVEENGWGKILLYRWTPGPPPSENEVFITSPTDKGKVLGDTDIEIKALVIDSDASIDKVEFYHGTTLLGSDDTAPYAYTWSEALAVGTYSLTAKAYDNGQLVGTSRPTTFEVYQLPDLTITDINWTPADPATGTPVTFSVTVKNAGLGPVLPGVVIGGVFSVDGRLVNWTDTYQSGLAPGASAVIAATSGPSQLSTWTMTSGTHWVSFLVDDINRVNEKREDNNTFSTYIKDAECADTLCASGAGLLYERWNNIVGSRLDDLLNNPNYPANSSSTSYIATFEAPTNAGYDFGARARGYVIAPVTGNYTFWIASDDESRLWLSTDENPANARSISWVPEWTGVRQWDRYDSQRSISIPLQAGQKYYVEALMKAGGANDNLAVGWQLPDGTLERPIPGNRLEPFAIIKSDLVVSQFSWTPANPTSSTPVTFSATVKNIGALATPAGTSVKVSFSVDGTSVAVVSTTALAPDESATVTATIPGLAAGMRVFKAEVDPNNEIAESDDNFNLRTRTVAVTATRRKYEAELALLQGAKIYKNRTGFSGTGFVQLASRSGNFVEWKVNAFAEGSHGVEFRYANELDRTTSMSLSVNGVMITPAVSFAPTGSWSNWSDVVMNLPLQAGVNTVRLTTLGSENPNLDYLAVTDPGAPALAPAAPAARMATAKPETADADGVVVFPNPAADHFTIRLTVARDGTAGIRLMDLLGRGMQTTQHEVKAGSNLIHLQAGHLRNGLYLLNVTTEEGKSLRKVQISR